MSLFLCTILLLFSCARHYVWRKKRCEEKKLCATQRHLNLWSQNGCDFMGPMWTDTHQTVLLPHESDEDSAFFCSSTNRTQLRKISFGLILLSAFKRNVRLNELIEIIKFDAICRFERYFAFHLVIFTGNVIVLQLICATTNWW